MLAMCVTDVCLQLLRGKDLTDGDIVGGSSCLHPACLQASLTHSLKSLRVDTVGAGSPHSSCSHHE